MSNCILKPTLFSAVLNEYRSEIFRAMSAGENGMASKSIFPASSFERSRISKN